MIVASEQSLELVVDLAADEARDVGLTGAKAAALAIATRAGLDVLPGVVLTTRFSADIDRGADLATHPALFEAWEAIGGRGRALVVRSSSVAEDGANASMAGQFASVIGVNGPDDLRSAVDTVLASRMRAGAPDTPIAVLVQPLLEPSAGGVLFGVDPVTGRSDRRVVAAVSGGPEPLVSGLVGGSRYVLDDRGAVQVHERGDGPVLDRVLLSRLVRLAETAAEVFGGPQDVEWAVDRDGTLWMLQSRPVTTTVRGIPAGPIYGPGPVAETFPEPLTELEEDLWVPPLRDAVREALVLAGAATQQVVDSRDVVVTVAGRVAIDLELAGELPPKAGLLGRLDPRPSIRQLRSSWRVGRLRAALPRLADAVLDRADAELEGMPPLSQLSSRQLLALLHRGRDVLRSLHAHEILLGMLTDTGGNRMTGASVALRVLVEGRRDGLGDDDILTRSPIVLALTAARVGRRAPLPRDALAIHLGTDHESSNENGILREALRLRIRWVQELTGQAAWVLAERLVAGGEIGDPELVRHLRLDHLDAIATRRAVVVPHLVTRHDGFGEPLPARFQISDRGLPVRVEVESRAAGGTGAGGGVGIGIVTHDALDPPSGSILVTTSLTPALGPVLPRLGGLIAETGSVLSHLAILAREAGVATVVGYVGATDELPEGLLVSVDGATGAVSIEEGDRA